VNGESFPSEMGTAAWPAGGRTRTGAFIALGLACLTLAAYWGAAANGFVNFDDQGYVTDNPHVLQGLTREGLAWAFSTFTLSNWHPLTWLSLMLDHDLYGLNAGGYHWTNVILHLAAGLILFGTLSGMTGSPLRSALAAGLFLVHPLHVESVAWVAERKDVLSGLFWMLSLWGYWRYAERPGWGRYGWVALFFVLGLMSKPMAVTLPLVLLLLDYWPLGRTGRFPLGRLVWEKVPLLALSAASSAVTFMAQQQGEAVATLKSLPFVDRLANALVAYAAYLAKAVWPVGLAVFYPHPGMWPLWRIALAVAVLAAVSVLAWRLRRSSPYLIAGWLWYLGTLVPVVGLVQVGSQSMADRYTYLPLVGIFIVVAWGLADLTGKGRRASLIAGAAAGALLLLLVLVTQLQVGYWKSSATLFGHALAVTEGNFLAHNNLARTLNNEGRYAEAADHYQAAIRINPGYLPPYLNLGLSREKQGMPDEAMRCFAEALKARPGDGEAHFLQGNLLAKAGRLDEAIAEYDLALKDKPGRGIFHNNRGIALVRKGDRAGALAAFREAVRLTPDHAGARNNLAMLLAGQGRLDEAIGQFREALRLQPGYANAHYELAMALKRKGLDAEAARHLAEARRIRPGIGTTQAAGSDQPIGSEGEIGR
jgi:tetratricopeptide (TPR) repeat protein